MNEDINARGETADEAEADFRSSWTPVDPADVPALVLAGTEVWSFGYGDGWMDPDGYTTIDESDLWAWGTDRDPSDPADGDFHAAVVAEWGPFGK